jgi:hypothetical protein
MFDSKHYIPILKWKPAEQQALEKLNNQEKGVISPLIQLVMPQPKLPKLGEIEKSREEQLEEVATSYKIKLPKIPEEILKSWGKSPAFIDFSLIYADYLRIESLNQILSVGEGLGLSLIPVVNLSSDIEVRKATALLVKKYNHGLCLRLVPADFSNLVDLSQEIQKFLVACSLSEKDVDLLIDLKEKDNQYLKFIDLSQKISNLNEWRTFTFASGAFPIDLTKCVLGENYIPRSDWNNWVGQINSKKLQRYPSFADYTILHPIQKESVRFFSPSASIRYTLKDQWLVMRGQKGKTVQYLANAQLLSQDQKFNGKFRGASFSFGDNYIVEKGKDLKTPKTGNATNWLTAGINCHLTCTASQIANLP